MLSLAEAVGALKALFAAGAAPPAQELTDALNDLLPAVRAAEGGALKASQREAEDAVLAVLLTPPGGGPPQRALSGDCLCALFTHAHGNSIAVFSRVSELTAELTSKEALKGKTPCAVRVGALQALTALAHALGGALAGSYGRIMSDVCPKHAAAAEAVVRAQALALLAAAAEHSPSLAPGSQEAAVKCAKVAAGDKSPAVRAQGSLLLRALALGADGAALFAGDRGAKGEVLMECVALAQTAIKDADRGARDAGAAALGALAAAAQFPPAASALAAAKPDARKLLSKALEDPVGEWLGASFIYAKSRPVRTAAAEAWVAMLALTAPRLEEAAVVTAATTAIVALRPLIGNAARVNAGDDDLHAAACSLYILRAGAAIHLPECGQRALLAALGAQLAGADSGDAGAAPPPLLLCAALRGVADTLSRLGEVLPEVAAAIEAPLRRCLAGGCSGLVRSEAALALRALALAYPPCATALLRAGLAGLKGADASAAEGPGMAALHGHGCLVEAILAAAPSLPLGLPAELPAAALEAAITLLSARAPAAKASGWTLLAAALAGPAGPRAASCHGATLLQLWNFAFAKEGLLAPPRRAGGASELRVKGPAGAAELVWRAAAAEALEAFFHTAVAVGPRAAASSASALCATLRSALVLAAEPALGEAAGPSGGPERPAAALLRLRLLDALQALPEAGAYEGVHAEAAAVARGCLEAGAQPARRLLLDLLPPADAALGPVPPGTDQLTDELRVFEGGADAAPPKLWLPLLRGRHRIGPYPSPLPVAMALAEAQARECGRLIAAGGPSTGLLAQLSAAAKAGYPVSRDLQARTPGASAFSGRAPSSSLRSEAAAGGSPQLTNAAAAGMAALEALAGGGCSVEEAAGLEQLALALLADPAPGAAHLRAAAELRAAAARLGGDATAPSRAVADELSLLRDGTQPAEKAASALCIGAQFRAAGGMALAPSVAAAFEALSGLAAAPDSSDHRAHVWAAHALFLVAGAAGAAYARHAPATLSLAHALLSSDDASAAPQLVASAGRLVNAAVGALGPELVPGGRELRRCVALIEHVRRAGASDPGAQLQQLLFLQACALFAPRALPPSAVAPQLRDALRSRQPPLRAAAAAVAHNLAETSPEGMLSEGIEAPLLGLLDFSYDAHAVTDARGALEALLRADAPHQPLRWLRLTGACACADFATRTAAGGGAAAEEEEEGDVDAAVASATAAAASVALSAAPLAGAAPALPSWRTRALAAELMSRVPELVGNAPQHLDLSLARASPHRGWLVLHLQSAVDLGYRVATGPAASLRPWGLLLLRRLLAQLGAAPDPDVPGHAVLMEQYSAQLLSSLRAAMAPGAAPPACAQGAALAAELLASGLAARDAGVLARVLALLGAVTIAWGPPPPKDEAGAPEYGQWSLACTKAAILTAHARIAFAENAAVRSAQAKFAKELAAGWLALLRDTAAAAGLPAEAAEEHVSVLALADVPLAQHCVAHAHLAAAWRPVLAAVAAGAAAGSVALSAEEHGMLLSLSCWALSREAGLFMRAAQRTDGGGPAGVWGIGAGHLLAEPHPACCGADALGSLLSRRFLNAPGFVPLETLTEVLCNVAAATTARGTHPLLATAAPQLLRRVAEALPEDALCGQQEETVEELCAACVAIAREGEADALVGIVSCAAAAAAHSAAAAGLPATALELALQALCEGHDAVALLAASAAGCRPEAVEAAAERLADSCVDIAEDVHRAHHLALLLQGLSALAVEGRSGTRRRCRDAFAILLDKEACCPLTVQRLALGELLRVQSAGGKWATSLLGAVGQAASAAVRRALRSHDPEAAAVASEGLKAFAAALGDEERREAVLSVLVPLLVEAAEGSLQPLAVALITRSATVAGAEAFAQVVGGLEAEVKARLQKVLRADAKAAGGEEATTRKAPGAISLAGFKKT